MRIRIIENDIVKNYRVCPTDCECSRERRKYCQRPKSWVERYGIATYMMREEVNRENMERLNE